MLRAIQPAANVITSMGTGVENDMMVPSATHEGWRDAVGNYSGSLLPFLDASADSTAS